LISIDSSGSFYWSYSGINMIKSPVVGAGGKIYTGSEDDMARAFDSSGQFLWSYSADILDFSPAVGVDDAIYLGHGSGVSALSSEGALIWSYSLPAVLATASDSEGNVYAGHLLGISALSSSGSSIWNFPTGSPGEAAPYPVIGEDGTLYVSVYGGGNGGWLACFKDVLLLEPGEMRAGNRFAFDLILKESIASLFDFYIVVDAGGPVYTIYLNGSIKTGVSPLYKKVRGFAAPYSIRVEPSALIPAEFGGREVTFYTAVVEAGKIPPVASLSELTPYTRYVIMLDKHAVRIAD